MKRRSVNEDTAEDAKEFYAHLQEAEATDLEDLERTGSVLIFIFIGSRNRHSRK